MTTERNVTATLSLDVSGFVRGLRQAKFAVNRLGFAMTGQPVPPMPREFYDGTAREYRAARRAYARQIRAHRKASR